MQQKHCFYKLTQQLPLPEICFNGKKKYFKKYTQKNYQKKNHKNIIIQITAGNKTEDLVLTRRLTCVGKIKFTLVFMLADHVTDTREMLLFYSNNMFCHMCLAELFTKVKTGFFLG